jgi:hypothetical protein
MAAPQTYIYDAALSFDGGVNSGQSPQLLSKNQLAWAVNATVRGGFVTSRSSFTKINLNGSFPNLLFQEAAYYQPDTGPESLFAVVGGSLFQISPDNTGGAVISDKTGGNNQSSSASQEWIWQSENFLIWNDGINLPVFFDGSTTRRSRGPAHQYGVVQSGQSYIPPSIGSSIVVNLAMGPSDTLPQVVQVSNPTQPDNGAYYFAQPVPASVNYLLVNYSDTAGFVWPVGTPIQVNNNLLAIITTGAAPTQTSPIGVPTTDGATITDHWPYTLTVFVSKASNLSVNQVVFLSNLPSGWGTINCNYNTSNDTFKNGGFLVTGVDTITNAVNLMFYSTTNGISSAIPNNVSYVQIASQTGTFTTIATIGSAFTVPAIGSSARVNIQGTYSGASPVYAWIGGTKQYQFVYNAPGASNQIQLTNISDSSTTSLSGLQLVTLAELPAGRMGAYGNGRNWISGIDGISYFAGDLVNSSSGSAASNGRDAVLKFTANSFLTSGNFRVPGQSGQITGMVFPPVLDSSLGQGPLQVFTQNAVFSVNTPSNVLEWQTTNNPLSTVSLKGSGSANQWGISLSNADIIFRSSDGQIRSLMLARLDFNQWGDTPISYEMTRELENEDTSRFPFISSDYFDNRTLMTSKPKTNGLGAVFPDIIALNYDEISTLAQKSPPVYDGIWRGLNVLKLVSGFFSGVERQFAFVQGTQGIELWEIQKTAQEPGFDNSTNPITMQIETCCFFNAIPTKTEFDLCRLWDGEIYADGFEGNVSFLVEYRPDYDVNWHTWSSWTVNGNEPYSTRMGFGEPPEDFNTPYQRSARDFYFCQLRITILGPARVRGIKLKAAIVPMQEFAPIVGTIDTPGINPANPIPFNP